MQCAEGQGHLRQSAQPRNAQQRQRPLAKRHRVGRPQPKQWGEIRHGWQHEHGVVCQQRVKSHHDVGATLAHDLDLVRLYLRHRAVHAPDGASRRLRLISSVVAGVQVATGGRIWVSTEGGYRVFVESREIFDRTVPTRKPQAVRWQATQPVLSPQEAVRTRPSRASPRTFQVRSPATRPRAGPSAARVRSSANSAERSRSIPTGTMSASARCRSSTHVAAS